MRCDLGFSRHLDLVADEVLSRERVEARGFHDYRQIEGLRRPDSGFAYPYETAMRLWTAILTELWAEEFVDRRGRGPDATASDTVELRRA